MANGTKDSQGNVALGQQHSNSPQSRNSNHSACRIFHTDLAFFPVNIILHECVYLYMNQSTPCRDTRKAVTTERKVVNSHSEETSPPLPTGFS